MKEAVVEKVLFARELLELSKGCFQTENSFANAAGIIMLQDAVEIFLLALAEHAEAGIKQKTQFNKYFDIIEEKVKKSLPKGQLLKLNQQRVNIKHHAFSPPHVDDCKHFFNSVEDFFENISNEYFCLPFQSISLIELLDESESKQHLKDAEMSLKNKDFMECLINCRKAIYIEIESKYSIELFKEGRIGSVLAGAFLSEAPHYAKSKTFVEQHVKEPTDYIVYDHSHLNMEMLKAGLMPENFWNVWRLTPKVFYFKDRNKWVIKQECNECEKSTLKENAEYCLWKTIEIVISLQKSRRQIKTLSTSGSVKVVKLKKKDIKVYKKSDKKSSVENILSPETGELICFYISSGLEDDAKYYNICRFKHDLISGFIHEDDVEELLDKDISYVVENQLTS